MRRIAIGSGVIVVLVCLACGGGPGSKASAVPTVKVEVGPNLAATRVKFDRWWLDAYGDMLTDLHLPKDAPRSVGSLDIRTTHYTADGVKLDGGTLSYPTIKPGETVRAKLTFPSTGKSARAVLELRD